MYVYIQLYVRIVSATLDVPLGVGALVDLAVAGVVYARRSGGTLIRSRRGKRVCGQKAQKERRLGESGSHFD